MGGGGVDAMKAYQSVSTFMEPPKSESPRRLRNCYFMASGDDKIYMLTLPWMQGIDTMIIGEHQKEN